MPARNVIADLRALAARTSDAQGAQRVAWGPVWRDARRWLDEVLARDGLRAETDVAGNNWITLPGTRPETVVIGGHLDSVPNGGWLDGALGVLAGVEALRRYSGSDAATRDARRRGLRRRRGRALLAQPAGVVGRQRQPRPRHRPQPRRSRGHAPRRRAGRERRRRQSHARGAAALDARRPRAYLELHIEQGPVLESMGRSTGAVIGTYGVERHVLRFVGQAAHSGSTPIAMRRDAFLAAAETALACRDIARRHSTPESGVVCTVGTVKVEPGIVTAVPGVCEISLDQRALEPATLQSALADAREAASRAAAANNVTVEWRRVWQIDPYRFDPRLVALCTEAVQEVTGHAPRLPSGPLHDAVEMARVMPAVMMFAMSTNGLSHCKEEDTPEARPRSDDRGLPAAGRQDRGDGRGRVAGRRARAPDSAVTQSAAMASPAGDRRTVVGLLVLLFAITYLDRVCISVSGPRMQAELGIDPIGWGWVTGIFTFAYCVFEIPTGTMGDRLGPRRVLTRIVGWWSAFTILTGAVSGFYPLLVVRFLFGAGEAGAFPNATIVVARWFKPAQRATMSGVNLMASQVGGAIAPLLVLPIQMRYGWRMPFFVFGVTGLVWAAVWHTWFRDSPEEKQRQRAPETPVAVAETHPSGHGLDWRAAAASQTVWAMLGLAFCYVYVYNFFQTWFHTFMVHGRGFSEAGLVLSALPYVVAVFANVAGGAASDALVRRFGTKRGRRLIGATALAAAGVFTIAAMLTTHPLLTVVFLALTYGAITFQQSGVFGVCLDIGGPHAGATVGLMNMIAQVGGLAGSVLYGYIVDRSGSYDAPFVPMAALLFIGSMLWLRVDASQKIGVVAPLVPVPDPA